MGWTSEDKLNLPQTNEASGSDSSAVIEGHPTSSAGKGERTITEENEADENTDSRGGDVHRANGSGL